MIRMYDKGGEVFLWTKKEIKAAWTDDTSHKHLSDPVQRGFLGYTVILPIAKIAHRVEWNSEALALYFSAAAIRQVMPGRGRYPQRCRFYPSTGELRVYCGGGNITSDQVRTTMQAMHTMAYNIATGSNRDPKRIFPKGDPFLVEQKSA